MDAKAPLPWGELMEVLQLARDPITSSHYWLDEAKYSRLNTVLPNFDQFVAYLISPVPEVDHIRNQLFLRPKIDCLPQSLQGLIFEFISLHRKEVSTKVAAKVGEKCKILYKNVDRRALLQLEKILMDRKSVHPPGLITVLDSVSGQEKAEFITPLHGPMPEVSPIFHCKEKITVNKRPREVVSDDEIFSKKMKLSQAEENDTSLSYIRLVTAFKDQNIHDILLFLLNESEDTVAVACKELLSSDLGNYDTTITQLSLQICKQTPQDSYTATKFLQHICLQCVKCTHKSISRQFLQSLVQISENYPLDFSDKFLLPFVSEIKMINKFQVAFLIAITKQALSRNEKLEVFRSLLNNKHLSNQDMKTVIVLYQGFLEMQLQLTDEDLKHISNIFSINAKECSKLFPFAKLMLTFIKGYGVKFSKENCITIESAILMNDTSLKSACRTALLNVKFN